MGPKVSRAKTPEDLAACLALRWDVFVTEQGVPPEDEQDGQDAACAHFLIRQAGQVVATARIMANGTEAKVQRVCVQRSCRGQGLGRVMMEALLEHARAQGHEVVCLGAQVEVIGFYEALGVAACKHPVLDLQTSGWAHISCDYRCWECVWETLVCRAQQRPRIYDCF